MSRTSIVIKHCAIRLGIPRVHKKEPCLSRIRTTLDPDNLEASLDKFKLTERGYKVEEIKGSFLKSPKFQCKELIADRSQNKQPPLVYITKYNPHLKNLGKPSTKAETNIQQRPEATVLKHPYDCVQTDQKHQRNISRK